MKSLIKEKLPAHIAIIMDGNGRWAEKRRLNRIMGHRRGIKRARETVDICGEIGIKYLTFYVFSRENWNRPKTEVMILMELLERHLKQEVNILMEKDMRFRAIGNLWELPHRLQDRIKETEEKTADNKGMLLSLALSYSGRGEIVEASKRLARDVKEGKLKEEDIDERLFSQYLYTDGIPDPDLLIRTGREIRVSNFLLWQIAYTEIYLTDVLWPDFKKDELFKAITDFQQRERRFGLTGEQLKTGAR